jgi:hypothetical protein
MEPITAALRRTLELVAAVLLGVVRLAGWTLHLLMTVLVAFTIGLFLGRSFSDD